MPPPLRLGTPTAHHSDGKAKSERDDSNVATSMKYGVASSLSSSHSTCIS